MGYQVSAKLSQVIDEARPRSSPSPAAGRASWSDDIAAARQKTVDLIEARVEAVAGDIIGVPFVAVLGLLSGAVPTHERAHKLFCPKAAPGAPVVGHVGPPSVSARAARRAPVIPAPPPP